MTSICKALNMRITICDDQVSLQGQEIAHLPLQSIFFKHELLCKERAVPFSNQIPSKPWLAGESDDMPI